MSKLIIRKVKFLNIYEPKMFLEKRTSVFLRFLLIYVTETARLTVELEQKAIFLLLDRFCND